MGPETTLQGEGDGWSGFVQKGTLRKVHKIGGAGWEEEGRRGGYTGETEDRGVDCRLAEKPRFQENG